MASRDLTLNLKVDSTSGQASIKTVAATLKKLETSKGISAASDDMKKLGVNASKAAEEYRKLIDASKADAERLRKIISVKKNAANADMRAIADASRADSDRLKKSLNAEKRLVAARNKAHSDAIRLEKQRLAAINKTNLFSIRMQKQRVAEINAAYNEAARMNKQHDKTNAILNKRVGIISKIKKSLFAMRSYWLAISAAVSIAAISVVKFFKAGFMAVERFRLSVASVAASITTFSDLSAGDVDKVYANAVKYSEKLALKMEIINVRTIATGEQLRAMNETFIQQGVLLDVNNKKQEDAFVSVANAISLITQGQNQEIQMRQEVRGLLSGDIRATNLLARMINTKLGGALKENIALWKQEGTLLENLGNHLEGFKAGSADLASTWAALSTTFETISNRWLRGVFKPVYEDIIKKSLIFSRSILEQKNVLGSTGEILKDEILTAWESLKSIAKGTWNILDGFKEPLLFMVKMVNQAVKGWALIFEHVTNIALTMKQKFLTEEGVRSWIIPFLRSIGYEGDVIPSTPLGEGGDVKETAKTPKLITPKTEDQLRVEENYLKKASDLNRKHQEEKIKLEYEGFERRKKLQELETSFLVIKYKDSLEVRTELYKLHDIKMSQIAKEEHEKVTKYISSEREDKTRSIMEEVTLMARAAKTQEEINKVKETGQAKLNALVTEAAEKRVEELEKIKALETETAEKKAESHEKVLQFISTEQENEIRALLATQEELLKKTDILEEQNAIRERTSELISKINEKEATALEMWAASTQTMSEIHDELMMVSAESFSSGIVDGFIAIVDGSKSGKEAIREFAEAYLKEAASMFLKTVLLESIKKLFGKTSETAASKAVAGNLAETASVSVLTTAYLSLASAKALAGIAGAVGGGGGGGIMAVANGGVFSQGHKMMEYAKGGVVNTPTIFPMANGAGLMGEAGPEAIMPLKRTNSGRLGVEAQINGDNGMGATTIIINAVDSKSFEEVVQRNPSGIVSVIKEALEDNSDLRGIIRNTI